MLKSVRTPAIKVLSDRYSTVAIAFHWAIAAGIVLQLTLGWHMGDLDGLPRSILLQVHKSVGVSILVLTVGRMVWRAMNPPPPHGAGLNRIERIASHAVHMGFYGLLLLLPLTGWAMVSLERTGGMKVFGAIPWPRFPFAALLPGNLQESLANVSGQAHALLVWVMLGLLGLHVAGALKHHFVSRDQTVARMVPGVKPGSFTDRRLLAIPAAVAVFAAVVYLPRLPLAAERPKPRDVAAADIYLDVVGPSLDRRCGFCHSDDQSRGGLSLTSYDAVMQGGRSGRAVIPGEPGKSDLLRRVSLPSDHKDFMPQDGKPPLTRSEVAAIGWWIAQGAPRSARVSTLKLTPEASAALKSILGGGDAASADDAGPARQVALPTVPAADKALVDKVVADGFIVRRMSAGSNLVAADYVAVKPVTEAAMADLARLGPQVLQLNLRHAGVTDAMVATIAALPNLANLRLEGNAVTDAAAKDIAGIKTLTYLNLVNTRITDAGFQQVAGLPKLERLFVWGTAVTPAAVDRAARKDLFLYAGLTAKDVPVDAKVMTPAN
ncbi:MAG: planctomycete cytochrome [Caulobacteraceae bacterium]|nr:planctomycete cytochrome [Caulobacteraceae bacterium]